MPPYETNGLQTMAVDQSGTPITAEKLFAQSESRRTQRPGLSSTAWIRAGWQRWPQVSLQPLLWRIQPHVAAAWNPRFSNGILGKMLGQGHTVVRGGWSRIFGRLNGVDLVLVPLLGSGPIAACHMSRRQHDGAVPGCRKSRPNERFPDWHRRHYGSAAHSYSDATPAELHRYQFSKGR